PSYLTNVNGTLFFTANEQALWKSDGTAAGTVMVSAINPSAGLTNVNGTVFFAANDGVQGTELWQSDGTAAGTVMVMDINPGGAGSGPFELADANNMLFFSANDGLHGAEPWVFQNNHFSASAAASSTAGTRFSITITAL